MIWGDDSMGDEFWDELYQLDPDDEYVNGAYTENGEQVYCDWCKDEMHWNPETRKWFCRGCLRELSRAEWFRYIDANPPGVKCLSMCEDNYPICKQWCLLYKIPNDDPIV